MKMREALIRNEFISVYKILYLDGIKSLNICNLQEPSTCIFFFSFSCCILISYGYENFMESFIMCSLRYEMT